MSRRKRIFDIFIAVLLIAALGGPALIIAVIVLVIDGRPVFFMSERMKTPGQGFLLFKFRTMRPSTLDSGVSGGDKAVRITRSGGILRATHLDELPQLFNILRGDMSFVGPRPPLRIYVERFPDVYGRVLRLRPGLTGLASLVFHRHEAQLLDACRTGPETDLIYARRCVRRKARLDLIYAKHQSLCFDLWLMICTIYPKTRRRAQVLPYGCAAPGPLPPKSDKSLLSKAEERLYCPPI